MRGSAEAQVGVSFDLHSDVYLIRKTVPRMTGSMHLASSRCPYKRRMRNSAPLSSVPRPAPWTDSETLGANRLTSVKTKTAVVPRTVQEIVGEILDYLTTDSGPGPLRPRALISKSRAPSCR